MKANKLSSTDKKKSEIRRVLRENKEGLTPKYISSYSGVKLSTTKKLLKKMEDVRQKEGFPGYYVLIEKTSGGMFDCKIENLRLSCSSNEINVEKRIIEKNKLNDLIKYRFEIGLKSQKATMTIATDYPLDFSCLGLVGHLFQELIEKHCNFRPDTNQIIVNTIEINKDYYNVTLEGGTSIRLDTALVEYKLYYKEKKYVREEYKLKVPVNLSFIRNLIETGPFYAEINQKLYKLSSDIKMLRRDVNRLTKTIPLVLKYKNKILKKGFSEPNF